MMASAAGDVHPKSSCTQRVALVSLCHEKAGQHGHTLHAKGGQQKGEESEGMEGKIRRKTMSSRVLRLLKALLI